MTAAGAIRNGLYLWFCRVALSNFRKHDDLTGTMAARRQTPACVVPVKLRRSAIASGHGNGDNIAAKEIGTKLIRGQQEGNR